MALQKEIQLDNGIILNYHRIVSLNKITNLQNIIEISSYVSKEQRDKEAVYNEIQKKNFEGIDLTEEEFEIMQKGINVLIESSSIIVDYDSNMTIDDAYEFIKSTYRFKGAIDN